MDPAGQPAVRVAVRALVDQLTAGCRPPFGEQAQTPIQELAQTLIQELAQTLIQELVTAGHWTPVERARIDGLRADATLAELIGQMLDGDGPVDPGHRLVRYVASAVQPTVPGKLPGTDRGGAAAAGRAHRGSGRRPAVVTRPGPAVGPPVERLEDRPVRQSSRRCRATPAGCLPCAMAPPCWPADCCRARPRCRCGKHLPASVQRCRTVDGRRPHGPVGIRPDMRTVGAGDRSRTRWRRPAPGGSPGRTRTTLLPPCRRQ
ncbi:curli production assembly/transport component CsgG [Micromonospora sp. Llam0]|nr:curli production assembly/transport component CsgG [Micromonospora sp. Llam0]